MTSQHWSLVLNEMFLLQCLILYPLIVSLLCLWQISLFRQSCWSWLKLWDGISINCPSGSQMLNPYCHWGTDFPYNVWMTYYYVVDEPNVWFNFERRCGISHDAELLFQADGWIVVVPDKWFGKIGKRLHIKRVFGYICLPSQFQVPSEFLH